MSWQPDYCTSADLKAYTKISDANDDAQIALAITTASRSIDAHCNRQFGLVAVAEARTYPTYVDWESRTYVAIIDDLMSPAITGMAVSVSGVVTTNFTLEPSNAALQGKPYTRLVLGGNAPDGVTVTARWGWSAIPTAITQAALFQANRLLARRQSPFGISGSPEQLGELRLLARIDPDVAVALRGFIRNRRVG